MSSITDFEVSRYGVIRMVGHVAPQTRNELYLGIDSWATDSPRGIFIAFEACRPLAWEVQSLYAELRSALVAELERVSALGRSYKGRVGALTARLKLMPTDPEDGADKWLLGLCQAEFEALVVPRVRRWFSEPPDWSNEAEFLPPAATPEGAAFEYFNMLSPDEREQLGIEIVEGEHPGSTFCAAELVVDVEEANRLAGELGVPVRFRHAS